MALGGVGGGRSQWFFMLALVFGVLAAGLTWVGLRQVQSQEEVVQRGRVMVPVVVARQDIPPRTILTEDMMDVREIAKEYVEQSAIQGTKDGKPEDLKRSVAGKATRLTILQGEQVKYSKLFAERSEAGLAFTIPAGKRAVAVSISEVTGAGGLILPADHVDVVAVCKAVVEGASQPAPGGGTVRYSEELKATYVLQDVEVLAVAQMLSGTEPEPAGVQQVAGTPVPSKAPQASPKPQPAARTVTLAVAPLEAQRLILYGQLCELRLVTRRFDDRATDSIPPAELNYGTAR